MSSLRRALCAALISVATLAGTALPAAAAEDHKAAHLPLTSATDILVDSAQGHVFVSSIADNAVVVTDLTGNVVTTLRNQWGAAGLALSPDGGTLFVALSTGRAISAIDTLTLAETARHPVGGGCPVHLAVTGNRLYFGYGCSTGNANVGSAAISPAFGDVRLKLMGADDYAAPLLATTPGRPDLLAVSGPRVSPATTKVYRTTGEGLTEQAAQNADSQMRDIALSTDGSLLYTAGAESPYDLKAYTTDNLSPQTGYELDSYPNAVSVSHDTDVLAAGTSSSAIPDVSIYRNGSHTPSRRYELAAALNDHKELAPSGLAWGAGGEWLYAVTTDFFGTPPTLHVLRG